MPILESKVVKRKTVVSEEIVEALKNGEFDIVERSMDMENVYTADPTVFPWEVTRRTLAHSRPLHRYVLELENGYQVTIQER